MIKIVALNEESSEESDEEDVQLVTREAQVIYKFKFLSKQNYKFK